MVGRGNALQRWIELVSAQVGPPGLGNVTNVVVPYAFNTATPLLLATGAGVVSRALVDVSAAFDGPGATMSIGTLANHNLILPTTSVTPGVVGQYGTQRVFVGLGNVFLFITPLGSTVGSGFAFLQYSP